MKDITTFLTNFTAPSTGYSFGRLKDDPGDATGSGMTVQYGNDWLYGFYAPIKKYLGAVSGADESESASDMMDAIETAIGIKNENVTDEWDNSTSYDQDDIVMHHGVQFVSMVGTNSGNNPFTSPDEWLPCLDRDSALQAFHKGKAIAGGFLPLHDKRNATYYREFFEYGKYNFGGNAGLNFQAYGVHLDGQVLTGDADYIAIFNIGESDEYHLLDTLAPDVMGTRTLLDAKGRVARIVDSSSGLTEDIGVTQEDAMQKITGYAELDSGNGLVNSGAVLSGVFSKNATPLGANAGAAGIGYGIDFDNANSTSPNSAKTNDDETIMKNYTEGLPTLLVMIAI